jgi:hypothetical protein
VEAGISAESWRIRQSSVELLGELLFKVSGTTGKVCHRARGAAAWLGGHTDHERTRVLAPSQIQTDTGSDDESVSTEAQGRLLLESLGEKRKAEVLAAVYLARSDVGLTVRSSSHVSLGWDRF